MFLRRFERRKNGKPHSYWALVESYRMAKGSRQRVVAYLGELTAVEQDGWAKLGSHLSGEAKARRPQLSLFDPPRQNEPRDDERLLVKLSSIRLERTRDFGDVWLAWGLWRMLGLDELLDELIEPGREKVSWSAMAAILTLARFCEPSSELHIADTWYRRTALEELLGVAPEQVHTDRLYKTLDRLLPHKEALEKHLRQRLGELFELKCDLLLYDVTSTYFEGEMQACPLAKRGYSRDSRPDRPQVCLGLVVTEDGYPLGYEVFAGNTHDSKTVQTIVESLENKHGSLNRVWVFDRGMVSEANLKFLRERGMSVLEDQMNRRILIVDDNGDIHGDYRSALTFDYDEDPLDDLESELFGERRPEKTSGPQFELTHAHQGQEGVDLLHREAERGRPFSLAFVDMRMPPGWDGLQTIQEAWRLDPQLQVVLCTAYSDYSWEQILDATSPGDRLLILKKPFDAVEIRQLALSLTTKWNLARAADRSQKELETAIDERTAELRLAKEAADRASRTKSEFLANVSHEVRTPLTAIIGFTKLLIDGFDRLAPAERLHYLQIVQDSAEHQLAIINDLLDLSKAEAGRMQAHRAACCPRQVVNETLKTLEHLAAEKRLSLENIWLGRIPETICTDASRLHQLLINLVGNAIKFTASGGVQIVGQMTERDARPRLKLDVIDTGIGISPEKLPAIFEPFVQADSSVTRQYGGTGLGLAISRSIAQALGGELAVTSRPGAGSTFSVEVDAGTPAAGVNPCRSEESLAAEGAARRPAVSLAARRILVVEDNPFNRKLIKLGLERLGAAVELAENGQAGVEQALAGPFDLILMDMQMPVMDGHTAVRRLRAADYSGPIVALTAHALDEEREKCLAAGCSDFLTKPIDFDRLAAVLGKLLAQTIASPKRRPAGEITPAFAEAEEADEFAQVAREYAASLSEVAARARQASAERDLASLAEIGHNLKGSGGTFGFAELTKIGARIEKIGVRQEFAQVAAALDELSELVERLAPKTAAR